jgi:hypothetical protein
VVDDVLEALEVLCNIDSIPVVFVFFDDLDSRGKFILLGTKPYDMMVASKPL